MATKNNLNNTVDPTVSPSEEVISSGTIANFEAIFKIHVLQWREEQRLLTVGRHVTSDEKTNLIKNQKAELKELLRLFNVPSTQKVLLPITWDTRETDPIGKELGNTILRHFENGYIIKPFKRGSDVDFHVWKDDLYNNLAVIA
uniref:Phosphoenolpyruvate carboxylase n=1 Tax=Strongyloides venezuelensis TaxID=75913 RepID=A0A0K0FZ94_STRVS